MTALDELAIPSFLRWEDDISRGPLFVFLSCCFSIHLIDHLFSPSLLLGCLSGEQFRAFRPEQVECLLRL
jgi:hypothetical protein